MEFIGAPRRRKLSRPWLTTAVLAVLLIGVILALYRLAPRLAKTPSAVTPERELADLKTLGLALHLHAEEHEGRFPSAIAGIEWRQNLPGLQRDGLPAAVGQFHDPATGREHRWLYYPGHTLSDPADTILAAAPFPIGKGRDQRLVVRLSTVAEIVREGDFQKQTAEAAANPPVEP